ncbi:MAG TPA: hypothetical protein VLK84_15275 [Longimicrobium sp.]|nr:hypothetical protein [Longimicrobium sp.]
MKLNPDDLEVTSFDTTDAAAEAELALATYTCTAFPTPATRCFICPPATSDCA